MLVNLRTTPSLFLRPIQIVRGYRSIRHHHARYPSQRFLLLRMQSVNYCDISGLQMLRGVVRMYRAKGGDVFLLRVRESILELMHASGFYDELGADHFLSEDDAIEYRFYKVLDPTICIYASKVRV